MTSLLVARRRLPRRAPRRLPVRAGHDRRLHAAHVARLSRADLPVDRRRDAARGVRRRHRARLTIVYCHGQGGDIGDSWPRIELLPARLQPVHLGLPRLRPVDGQADRAGHPRRHERCGATFRARELDGNGSSTTAARSAARRASTWRRAIRRPRSSTSRRSLGRRARRRRRRRRSAAQLRRRRLVEQPGQDRHARRGAVPGAPRHRRRLRAAEVRASS